MLLSSEWKGWKRSPWWPVHLHLLNSGHVSQHPVCLSECLLHLTLIHLNERPGQWNTRSSVLFPYSDELLIFYFCYTSMAVNFVLSGVIWNHKIVNFGDLLFFFNPIEMQCVQCIPISRIDCMQCTTWKQYSISSRPSPSKINGPLLAPGRLIDTEWDWFCWIRDESLWVSPCCQELWNIIIYRGGRLTSLI